jgi:hypothetical protein
VKAATWLRLAVQLSAVAPERMPEPSAWSLPDCAQPNVPLVTLLPFEASAPAKLRRVLSFVPNA